MHTGPPIVLHILQGDVYIVLLTAALSTNNLHILYPSQNVDRFTYLSA